MKANKFAAELTSSIANCSIDPLQATILCQVSAGYANAADIAEQLNMTTRRAAGQLVVMRKAGLVSKDSLGQHELAQGGKDTLRELLDFLHQDS